MIKGALHCFNLQVVLTIVIFWCYKASFLFRQVHVKNNKTKFKIVKVQIYFLLLFYIISS